MGYISWLPNKLQPTGIQLNSIKVSFVGHHRRGAGVALTPRVFQLPREGMNFDWSVYTPV